MIAPADLFEAHIDRIQPPAPQNTTVADELLPWADPYIAQLMYQHEVELASQPVTRSADHPRLVSVERGNLLAVA